MKKCKSDDDIRKERKRQYNREYYRKNKDKIALQSKIYYEENREKIRKSQAEYHSKYYSENKELKLTKTKKYQSENKEKEKEHKKQYYLENKEEFRKRGRVISAKRRASKFNATPSWSEKEKIEVLYKKAKWLESLTGLKYHVDHVIPLNHPDVCGLHVWANLQILEGFINRSKNNNFIIKK